jgi:hypothetical protein
MANEFKIKNGYLSEGNSQITGSLNVSAGITGSLFGTASYAVTALTASYYSGSVTSASYATTASYVQNAQTASYVLNAVSSSYALTASYVDTLNQNVIINGNLNVNGTASYTYVTASQLDVGTNFISVNVAEPGERFGGLRVYDSGSLSHLATASLAWDSQKNHWIYQNASGSTYSGGMLLAGPRNTGSLGDEPSLTRWFVTRGDGGDHVNDTQIYSSGSIHIVTGSLTVTAGITGSLEGTASFATTAQTAQTASYVLQAVSASFATTAQTANTASYVLNAVSASYATNALSSSFSSTASYVQTAQTASYVLQAVSSSYASTISISNDADTRVITANGNGTLNAEGNLTFDGNALKLLYQSGDEGGEMLLSKPVTNTTIAGTGVTVDIYQNRLRFFEQGGTARGFYLDITTGGAGVATNLASGGGTVTSVDTAGTVNGITLTGGPITGAGTITLGGTLSNITPSQLATSSIMIGSTNIALGATASLLTGLTSINSTSFTGSLQGTASYATQALSASWAPGGGNAFPYTGSAEITGSLTVTGSFSVNNGTNVKLDTATSTLTDDSNISSVDWQNRISYDTTQLQSIDWANRYLYDSATTPSIQWGSRVLTDIVGNSSLDWDANSNNGKSIFFSYNLKRINNNIQEIFSDVASLGFNYEGEAINGTLDVSVAQFDLIYLETDGIWYQTTQATADCSKLLGICIDVGRQIILLEGSLTVTSDNSLTDSPYVQSIDHGLPIYIKDSSGTQMSTVQPTATGQYVRILGHAYYNNITDSNYWTMKFRPSNDWYSI